jgi:hypothetical protein
MSGYFVFKKSKICSILNEFGNIILNLFVFQCYLSFYDRGLLCIYTSTSPICSSHVFVKLANQEGF